MIKYPVRLDKLIAHLTGITRSQCKQLLRAGAATINGEPCRDGAHHVKEQDSVLWQGEALRSSSPLYLLLYKPAGYVSSTTDSEHLSALHLVDASLRSRLHIAGRLDVDTTGALLLTDDGDWSHRVTSPRHQKSKTYLVTLARPIREEELLPLRQGIMLHGEENATLPAEAVWLSDHQVRLTICEGRYHQVKRMFAAIGNHVSALHREQVGSLTLEGLQAGQWRHLSAAEVAAF